MSVEPQTIALRFLLHDGHGLDAIVTLEDATKIFAFYVNDSDNRENHILADVAPPPGGHCWAVDLRQVQAILQLPIQQSQTVQQGAMLSPMMPRGTSGFPR